ncbi:unnamed protein product [Caenorhabditis angaria]|uniref:Uncharacterized protein n=1 Tax=Caenorhabditis angaria TaxID=860376 RepID=A0A9P1J2Q5_9PELO|nr:unnamed protein product [Caenorhabditis angaria]
MIEITTFKNYPLRFNNPARLIKEQKASDVFYVQKGDIMWRFRLINIKGVLYFKILIQIGDEKAWASQIKGEIKWKDKTLKLTKADIYTNLEPGYQVRGQIPEVLPIWAKQETELILFLNLETVCWTYYKKKNYMSEMKIRGVSFFYDPEDYEEIGKTIARYPLGPNEVYSTDEIEVLDVVMYLSCCLPEHNAHMNSVNLKGILSVACHFEEPLLIECCVNIIKEGTMMSWQDQVELASDLSLEELLRHCCFNFNNFKSLVIYLNRDDIGISQWAREIMMDEGKTIFAENIPIPDDDMMMS